MGKRKEPSRSDNDIEYHCSAFFSYNKLNKQQEYCIRLETTKVFNTLSYRLQVEGEKKKKELNFSILGLLPDQAYLAEIKPAISDTFFSEIYGDYLVNIKRKDGSINSARFNFNIFKREIILIEEFINPDKDIKQFCVFHTAEDLNTFSQDIYAT